MQIQIDLEDVGNEWLELVNSSTNLTGGDQLTLLSHALGVRNSSKLKLSTHYRPTKLSYSQFATLGVFNSLVNRVFITPVIKFFDFIHNHRSNVAPRFEIEKQKRPRNQSEENYTNVRIYGQEGHIHYSFRPTYKYLDKIVVDHETIREALALRLDKLHEENNYVFFKLYCSYQCFAVTRGNKLNSDTWVGTVVFGGNDGVVSSACSVFVASMYDIESNRLVWRDSGQYL